MKTSDTIISHRSILLMVLLFFFLLLPILSEVSTYHSDEHYYTDSAVYMVQHSDYLTPHYSDGSLRTKKPILTYWLIIAGYAVFGVTFFAARFPFLLAGCAMLWLTWLMAMQLFRERRVAFLAAVVLASNMQYLALCLRATPDIVQVLFMNVSLFGFVAIVFNGDGRLRNYLYLYFGAALVIQTKGLLGVVLLGFIFVCYWVICKRKPSCLRITHWPLMAVAAAIALSWYLYMAVQHGGGTLGGFYTDQIGGKINGSRWYFFSNLINYLWGVFRNFLPWTLMLAVATIGYRKVIAGGLRRYRKPVLFILAWLAILLLIFIGSSDCRTRYLVPAYPLLSILISFLLWQVLEKPVIQQIWRWLGASFVVLTGLCAAVFLWFGAMLHWQMTIAGLILLGSCAVAAWALRRGRERWSPLVVGGMLFVVFSVSRAFVLPIFEFGPSKSLAACVLADQPAGQSVTIWSPSRANFLRQLYSLSQGRILVRYFKRGQLPKDLDHRPLVVLNKAEKESYKFDDYGIEPCGAVFRVPDFNAVWRAMRDGDRDAVFKSMQNPIFLARRNGSGRLKESFN